MAHIVAVAVAAVHMAALRVDTKRKVAHFAVQGTGTEPVDMRIAAVNAAAPGVVEVAAAAVVDRTIEDIVP